MRNVTETWLRITLPLTFLDKIMLAILTAVLATNISLWVVDPTWGNAWDVLYILTTVAVFWRWFWVEGCQRMFRGMTNMGYVIGKDLHEYGDLLISKHGKEYRVTPLTHSRDT